MRQSRFEEAYGPQWAELTRMLDELPGRDLSDKRKGELEEIPRLYRRVCCHYGLALRRRYTSGLAGQLHALILDGHRRIHQNRGRSLHEVLAFLHTVFPRQVRAAWAYVAAALLFFLAPALVTAFWTYRDPTAIHALMSPMQVSHLEDNYHERKTRTAEQDIAMFGHYIQNNVSIDFRTFAGGILFGGGALLVLVYNGVFMGGASGHLSHPPFGDNYWAFVIGHAPLELSAMILAGAAGLMLGVTLLRPSPWRRLDALRLAATPAMQILLGAALMTTLAAVIEAFWSALPMPMPVKIGFSALNWALILTYFAFCGRRRHAA